MDLLCNNSLPCANSGLELANAEDSNLTLYVFDFGPRRDSLSSVIPVTVIYVAIFISGLVGNVCTCFVIYRNRHMRTATNYYLFSLAISDLLLLVVGLPQELYQLWRRYPYAFGEAFCVLRGFASETSTNASILTIVCFSSERYLAICHPLRAHTMSTPRRAVKITVAAWLAAALCAVPTAIQFGVTVKDFEGRPVLETAECTVKHPLQDAFATSTFCFFILPMALISVLYACIGLQLRASEAAAASDGPEAGKQDSLRRTQLVKLLGRQFPRRPQATATTSAAGAAAAGGSLRRMQLVKLLSRQSTRSIRGTGISGRKAVIKMLFAVVVAFFLCWAPFHGQRLMAIYVQHHTPTVVMIYTVLTYISGVTYYVSATINPILYSIMSKKFRQAFKDTFVSCHSKNGYFSQESSRYNSYISKFNRQSTLSSINNSFHKKV